MSRAARTRKRNWRTPGRRLRMRKKELADGEKEIEDAEQDLADIDYPEWYVYDRSILPENTGFGDNANRIKNIGEVFPVLFFLWPR